jgi:FKBP-type peptidyl-prolyl cis-trans isomerase FklB
MCSFAEPSAPCENTSMKKQFTLTVTLLMAGMMPFDNARAQQTPAANSQPVPAAKGSPANTQQAPVAKAPAAKTGQAPAAKRQTPLTLKTPKDKASYAIGLNIGRGMRKDAVDIDPNILSRGLKDGLAGGKPLLTDEEAKTALMVLQSDVRKKQADKMLMVGETNKKEGEEFLAANKPKEGVVTLPSGLQYKILKEGAGPKPSATDSVVCNYRGTLLNDTEFDSSYKRGQPATFPVGGVIKGWTEALQLMPVGSKWQLFVPSELAYGQRGPSPEIGPNSTLIFEVELLSIQDKATGAQPPAAKPN